MKKPGSQPHPSMKPRGMPFWAKLLLVFTVVDMVLGLAALLVLQQYL